MIQNLSWMSANGLGGRISRSASASPFGAYSWRERLPQNEPQPQYELLPDGQVVRMRCPKCGADLFRSMLGFLNHCRIHCHLAFTSSEDRLSRCGVRVSPEEASRFLQQSRNPTLLKQRLDLALIRAEFQGPATSAIGGTSEGIEGLKTEATYCDKHTLLLQKSRYYVKRPIIIGNEAKALPLRSIKNGNKATHIWRIYVKDPSSQFGGHQEPISSLIKGIRFILHPSYKPNDTFDVLEVSEDGAFGLTRTGWGEFPIRVQVHFLDAVHNEPIELVHQLRVENASSAGRMQVMSEHLHNIEISRRTMFSHSGNESFSLPSFPTRTSLETGEAKNILLTSILEDFSLVGAIQSSKAKQVRYSPVCSSFDDFIRLSLSKQLLLEDVRARAVKAFLSSRYPLFSLNTAEIRDWFREHGMPSHIVSHLKKHETDEASRLLDPQEAELLYCKFCGSPHYPQAKFDVLQKNCSYRPRKVHISSRSSVKELQLPESLLYPENSELVKRAKHEYMISSSFGYYLNENDDASGSDPVEYPDEVVAWIAEVLRKYSSPFKSRPFKLESTIMASKAMKYFLEDLIKSATQEISSTCEEKDSQLLILTPLHVFHAITKKGGMDFISNSYMSSGSTKIERGG